MQHGYEKGYREVIYDKVIIWHAMNNDRAFKKALFPRMGPAKEKHSWTSIYFSGKVTAVELNETSLNNLIIYTHEFTYT